VNVSQWFDTALQLARVQRLLARVINEVAELSSVVLDLAQWKEKLMATFDEINAKLDTIVSGQEAAAVAAGELRDDITDLKDLISNQNQGGLSEGQANAIATRLDTIATAAGALQTSLSETAALHTPTTPPPPPPPPPDEPPAPI
jgi:hypothetical protein